jgi:hypothetical protein
MSSLCIQAVCSRRRDFVAPKKYDFVAPKKYMRRRIGALTVVNFAAT